MDRVPCFIGVERNNVYLPRQNSRTNPAYGFAGFGLTLPDLAAAITRMEGSCTSAGVCRNNNPGNLRAYAAGQPVDSRGIRIFPDYQSGYDALLAQESLNISKGLTVDEFFGGKAGVYPGYAPAADKNNPNVYAGNVSNWLNIPRDVPLSELLGGGHVSDTGATAPVGAGVDAGDGYYSPVGDGSDAWVLPADGEELSPLAWGAIALGVGAALWAAV